MATMANYVVMALKLSRYCVLTRHVTNYYGSITIFAYDDVLLWHMFTVCYNIVNISLFYQWNFSCITQN